MRRLALALAATQLLMTAACSLKPYGDSARLIIDMQGRASSAAARRTSSGMVAQGHSSAAVQQAGGPTLPATIDGFNCFFVNVMGPGIPSRGPSAPPGGVCKSPGITSPLFSPDQAVVEMKVQSGPGRLVQMIGVMMANGGACPVGKNYWELEASQPFCDPALGTCTPLFMMTEVGIAKADLFGDTTVEISNSYFGPPPAGTDSYPFKCAMGAPTSWDQVPGLRFNLSVDSLAGSPDASLVNNWDAMAPGGATIPGVSFGGSYYYANQLGTGIPALNPAAFDFGNVLNDVLFAQPWVIFVAGMSNSAGGILLAKSNGGDGVELGLDYFGGPDLRMGMKIYDPGAAPGVARRRMQTSVGDANAAVFTFVYDPLDTNVANRLRLVRNGVMPAQSDDTAAPFDPTNSGIPVNTANSSVLAVGTLSNNSQVNYGGIAQVMIYQGRMPDSSRSMIECYLSAKYQISVAGCPAVSGGGGL